MKPKETPKKHHRIRNSLFILIAVLAVLLLDSRFRLVTTEYELSYDNLPAAFDGFRIVQLSDLHMREYGEDNSRLIEKVSELQPDIIVLTGDFADKLHGNLGSQSQVLAPTFQGLAEIAPCYFVSGNHEWASGDIENLRTVLKDCGIKYLHNEFVLLERDGDSIILAGVEDPNGPADMLRPEELVDIINDNYPDKLSILLAHRNDYLKRYSDIDVDIIISGHAHGGIVRLPLLGGVLGTEGDFFPKYDSGLYNEGGFDMVLSRGLGDSIPLVRFLNNPEIVSIVLHTK